MSKPRRLVYYDPDPDPIAITTLVAIAFICVAGGVLGFSLTNPNFFNNLIFALNPEMKELAEDEQKTKREFYRVLMIICLIALAVVVLILLARWGRKKKVGRLI